MKETKSSLSCSRNYPPCTRFRKCRPYASLIHFKFSYIIYLRRFLKFYCKSIRRFLCFSSVFYLFIYLSPSLTYTHILSGNQYTLRGLDETRCLTTWSPQDLTPEVRQRKLQAFTHFHPVSSLRINVAAPPHTHKSTCTSTNNSASKYPTFSTLLSLLPSEVQMLSLGLRPKIPRRLQPADTTVQYAVASRNTLHGHRRTYHDNEASIFNHDVGKRLVKHTASNPLTP